MEKILQREIKNGVRAGYFTDITNASGKDLPNFYDVDTIAYSVGIYGINGGLLRNRQTGEIYAITCRATLVVLFRKNSERLSSKE